MLMKTNTPEQPKNSACDGQEKINNFPSLTP